MALKRIPVPVSIDLEDGGKRIAFTWPDGRRQVLTAFDLRLACPCAECEDEITGERTLRAEDVDPEVTAVSFGRVGRYGVQFEWSDGHNAGIYSYEHLRDGKYERTS